MGDMRGFRECGLIVQSAFVPAVKSILSSNAEDERKRKEARRKSLGTARQLHRNGRCFV